MKALALSSLVSLFTFSAFATIDTNDHAFVVVQHIQSSEFFVERVPIIGCYGVPNGPQLIQFTAPYLATANIGCGGGSALDNINYLTCGKIVSHEENEDASMKALTLDISKCDAKDDKGLIRAVKSAVNLNFSEKKNKVVLTLIK
jgi:hypothetical protein